MKPTGDTSPSHEAPQPQVSAWDLQSAALPVIPSASSVDTAGSLPGVITKALRAYTSTAVVEIVKEIVYSRCCERCDVAFEVFTRLSDTALARVDHFASKRTIRRVEDLSLGLYVAEAEGIWTPIGTVSDVRLSSYRRGMNKDALCGALHSLTLAQLVSLLDTTLSQRRLLDRVLVPFIKLGQVAAPLRRAAKARVAQENQ